MDLDLTVTGFDADLGTRAPGLFQRDEAYASDTAAYQAVVDAPTLAIVPTTFLVGGPGGAQLDVGDSFTLIELRAAASLES